MYVQSLLLATSNIVVCHLVFFTTNALYWTLKYCSEFMLGNCKERSRAGDKHTCYIVSVKVQFFCIAIGQKRIACWSAKRRVHSIALETRRPVHNNTYINRSTTEWVNCACALTAKF